MGKGLWKSALVGSLVALLLGAGVAAWLLYLRDHPVDSLVKSPTSVVVVLASPAADGSMVAQAIGIVTGSHLQPVSPDTSVTIPGTSFTRLGDAYAFGGAAAVAAAAASGTPSPQRGWIDLPTSAWTSLVDRAGGVTVTVPADVRVFDGNRLTSLSAGTQKLSGAQSATLFLALGSAPATAQAGVRASVLGGIMPALARESSTPGLIRSNVDADYLTGWLLHLSGVAVDASGVVVP